VYKLKRRLIHRLFCDCYGLLMAASASEVAVDITKLTGDFDLSCAVNYNLINLGRFVVNNFANAFNFCSELKLINSWRTCERCRRELKLSVDRRSDSSQTFPVVFRCTNNCKKQYYSVRDGSFFDGSMLSL